MFVIDFVFQQKVDDALVTYRGKLRNVSRPSRKVCCDICDREITGAHWMLLIVCMTDNKVNDCEWSGYRVCHEHAIDLQEALMLFLVSLDVHGVADQGFEDIFEQYLEHSDLN